VLGLPLTTLLTLRVSWREPGCRRGPFQTLVNLPAKPHYFSRPKEQIPSAAEILAPAAPKGLMK